MIQISREILCVLGSRYLFLIQKRKPHPS